MARDVKKQAMSQSAQAQQQTQALEQQRQGQQSRLTRGYEQIAAAPGYNQDEKGAITRATMGGLGATYDALQNSAGLRSARTRNESGYNELLGQLARTRGRQAGEIGATTEAGFADVRRADRNTALSGLGSIYGVNTDLLARQMGLPAQYLNIAGNQKEWWENLLPGAVGGVAGGVGAALGKKIG